MRVFFSGAGPRNAHLRERIVATGLELVPTLDGADIWVCCQPEPHEGPVFRHETLAELQHTVRELTRPITICLVSFEPNTIWPAGFCHAADTTIRGNTGQPWQMTRAHVQSSTLQRTSPLILGADSDEAGDLLREVWQPLSDLPAPLPVWSVLRAELEAAK
jgi:hypothetical protein